VKKISEDEHSSLEWDNEGLLPHSGTAEDISICLESVDEELAQQDPPVPAGINRNTSISPCLSTSTTVRSERDRSSSPVTTVSVASGGSFLDVGSGRQQPSALWCSQESGYLEWESVGGGTASSSTNNSVVHTPGDSSSSVLSPLLENRYWTLSFIPEFRISGSHFQRIANSSSSQI
jgi:hypothetical protein